MKYGKLSRKDIAELERLAETPEGVAALTEFVEKQKEARSAYKRYVKIINKKEKTPNEIRAAFIEKCKGYIEMHSRGVTFYKGEDEGEGEGFIATKGTLYGVSRIEGVRNEYIEKANAIAWLFKDYNFVDETRNAPQPNESVIGSKIKWGVREYEVIKDGYSTIVGITCHESSNVAKEGVIINDTKSRYKEGTK